MKPGFSWSSLCHHFCFILMICHSVIIRTFCYVVNDADEFSEKCFSPHPSADFVASEGACRDALSGSSESGLKQSGRCWWEKHA